MVAQAKGGRRRNLLIELGTEELPPKSLRRMSAVFSEHFFAVLVEAGLAIAGAENVHSFATPRRLGVWIKGVAAQQPDYWQARRGPALTQAFDANGEPTPAAQGFARSCGVTVAELGKIETDKGAWLNFSRQVAGETLATVVSRALAESVQQLPTPKRMRWGKSELEFVRPVHWLLALYGSELVKTEVLGLQSERYTRGHRFHTQRPIRVSSADSYARTLANRGFVIADYDQRKSAIREQAESLATAQGGRVVLEAELLDEVTALVEWPVAHLGRFSAEFLSLPREVLVSTMQEQQKYFPVTDGRGVLQAMFVVISNIASHAPQRVRQGNERVLRARFADARFFWDTDQKQPFADRSEALKSILFHDRLGSIADKIRRIEKLALSLALPLGADREMVKMAVALCKNDLTTDMVGEFPRLQGVIGRYYALSQGLPRPVADAVEQHYLPRYANDALPQAATGQCLALADRADTLIGIFACAEMPTGERDPYGLRRAALGLIRIAVECRLAVSIDALLRDAMQGYRQTDLSRIDTADKVVEDATRFVAERMKGYFMAQGFGAEQFAAVAASAARAPRDFQQRLAALQRFCRRQKGAATALAAANKRIANILAQAENSPTEDRKEAPFSPHLITDEAERQLADAVQSVRQKVEEDFAAARYEAGLQSLAGLRQPVDDFFDQVMVNHEDAQIRTNRRALLRQIRQLFLGVADISKVRLG